MAVSPVQKALRAFRKLALGDDSPSDDDVFSCDRVREAVLNGTQTYECEEIRDFDRIGGISFRELVTKEFRTRLLERNLKISAAAEPADVPISTVNEPEQGLQRAFPFEYLPWELRRKIYTEYVPYDGIVYAPDGKASLRSRAKDMRYGLALTNKWISEEFIDFVHSKVTFHFEVGALRTQSVNLDYPISDHSRKRITRCKFIVESSSQLYWTKRGESYALYLPRLIQDFPSLKEMRVGTRLWRNARCSSATMLDSDGTPIDDVLVDTSARGLLTGDGMYFLPNRAAGVRRL